MLSSCYFVITNRTELLLLITVHESVPEQVINFFAKVVIFTLLFVSLCPSLQYFKKNDRNRSYTYKNFMNLPKFIITMDGYFRLGMVNQYKDTANRIL